MDEVINTTTTTNGSTTETVQQISYPTSSPEYAFAYNAAALIWLVYLALTTAIFFTIFYYAYKRFKK